MALLSWSFKGSIKMKTISQSKVNNFHIKALCYMHGPKLFVFNHVGK